MYRAVELSAARLVEVCLFESKSREASTMTKNPASGGIAPRLSLVALALAAMACLPSCANDQGTRALGNADAGRQDVSGVIPFDYASPQAPLIVVQAKVGEGRDKMEVVLDTGAAAPFAVFVSEAVAKRQALALSEEIVPTDTIAVGSRRQGYRTAKLARFELGQVTLGATDIAVVPMIDRMSVGRRVDAIVGYHFLRDRRFAIDYRARAIDLAAPPGPDAEAIRFVLAAKKPLILVEAMVNGAGPFTLEVDTGTSSTILSRSAAARAQVAATGASVQSGAGGLMQVDVGTASVKLGSVHRALKFVSISEAMDPIGAAAGTSIDGILGTDFFSCCRLTVDYPNQSLWLTPGTGPPAPRHCVLDDGRL